MAVTNTVAIAATQSAATAASDITIDAGSAIQVWTNVPLAPGEAVKFYRTNGGSPEVVATLREGDRPVQLGAGRHSVLLQGPMTVRIHKEATATATAVYYDS